MSTTIDPERHAMGVSMKRKEDPRFIRGRGNYWTTTACPGCCTSRSCTVPIRMRAS